MELTKKRYACLNAHQIKVIALIAMTLDHFAAYGFEIPIFDAYYTKLRIVGRIAAPLFMFILTESVRHTRSRPKFLLRLYLGAVCVGLFTTITNFLFRNTIGDFSQNNMLFTFFYTALYIILIERIVSSVKTWNWKDCILSVAGIAASCIPHYLYMYFLDINLDVEFRYARFVKDLTQSLIASPINVEYSILFIIMGVMIYFANSKLRKAAVLALFSLIGFSCSFIPILGSTIIAHALGGTQCYMVLAIPFILLYNGEKGISHKYFFYFYYPLHRYAISIAVYFYQMFYGA